MSQATWVFETDRTTGIPSLRPGEGQAGAPGQAEFDELERAIRARYEQLRREPTSTLRVGSRQYAVENREPNGSRQPTLLIRPAIPSHGEAADRGNGPPWPSSGGWTGRFFAEVARLSEAPTMPRFEARAVVAAIEELQAIAEATPEGSAVLLLAGYLALAEQTCRGEDAERSAVYALALRGLDRILPELPAGEGPGWKRGGLGAFKAEPGAGRNRIGRMLGRLIGLKDHTPGPA